MGMLKMLLGNGVKMQQSTEKEASGSKEGAKERKEGLTTEASVLEALRPQISQVNGTPCLWEYHKDTLICVWSLVILVVGYVYLIL